MFFQKIRLLVGWRKKVVVSSAGNVAIYAIEKAQQLGATPGAK